MKLLLASSILVIVSFFSETSFAQTRKLAAIGSSSVAGLATSHPDSSWLRRISYYYKNVLGSLDTAYNLGVSSTNIYHGMPSSYVPPAGRPAPDPLHNVTRAVSLLSDLTVPANGVIIVGFPTGGYDTYSVAEIMSAFQRIYDSATRAGNRCFITTTQPRTDGNFANSAVKRKLADLKDSIINRFGVANTINFWDGLYNPADTSILPAYSAGDNVHFNNAGHRILFERVRDKNVFNLPMPAYRSNVASTGLWSDPGSWQVFNGSAWVAATMAPSSGSGTITIVAGDSIRINSFTELDQVIIEEGGVLTIFSNTGTPPPQSVATVNDGPGDDLVNNGRLYVSGNGLLNGSGTARNGAGGLFTIRNRGVLQMNLVNDGMIWVNSTGIVRDRVLTNNKTFVLADFTLQLIRSTFINNDSLSVNGAGNTFFADSTLSGGTFINSVTGKIVRQATAGITTFTQSVSFRNQGQLKGNGTYVVNNPVVGVSGNIHPGTSPGSLTVNPALFNGRTPNVNIEIAGNGAVQGVNYDHLIISNTGTSVKNISGTSLTVIDNASDPIGTEYIIITPLSGTITGTFAQVQLSPTLVGPDYHGGAYISVTKSATLPLVWGPVNVKQIQNGAQLEWITLQEVNTDRFEIEHSLTGNDFTKIGSVTAGGNTPDERRYQFVHTAFRTGRTNYYRVKQFDRDGRSSYSKTVALLTLGADGFLLYPNPARNFIEANSPAAGRLFIYDATGRSVMSAVLKEGYQRLDVNHLPRGIFSVVFVGEKGEKLFDTKLILTN